MFAFGAVSPEIVSRPKPAERVIAASGQSLERLHPMVLSNVVELLNCLIISVVCSFS